ncbi:MAG: GIY-YIG nuclease family protein [Nitrosotalea sp.]
MNDKIQIWSLYRITNKVSGKIYIGQAADVSKRWYDHRNAAKKQ